jgi:hypothetical protein
VLGFTAGLIEDALVEPMSAMKKPAWNLAIPGRLIDFDRQTVLMD